MLTLFFGEGKSPLFPKNGGGKGKNLYLLREFGDSHQAVRTDRNLYSKKLVESQVGIHFRKLHGLKESQMVLKYPKMQYGRESGYPQQN